MQAPYATPLFPSRLAAFDLRTTPLLRTEVLVIGSGIAGACTALAAAEAGAEVLLLAKGALDDTNTAWAQGGIAVVQLPEDSVESHLADTLRVGAGVADAAVVRHVVHSAQAAIEWLERLGTHFDRRAGDPDGALELSREGGHSFARVVHSNGDATGHEIQRALAVALQSHPRITVRAHAFVRDLVLADGRCVGAIAMQDGMEIGVEAGAIVVATGGTGQIYRETTNPTGASGDGHALCFRAGARMADCEFVQFHPTTLYIAGASRFLISEVVRGAGAVLRDRNGERFMQGAHPMQELAPRDVVSRAILDRMVATNDTHVYLDLSTVQGDPHKLFPSIARICSTFDLDLAKDPIPVRPGAHYFVGGAVTDGHGKTSVPGLFAVGEAAASGLHGANRLASNSLLEGAVIGQAAGRAAADTARERHPGLPRRGTGPSLPQDPPRLLHDDLLYSLKSLMWRQVGLRRTEASLRDARERIGFWHHYLIKAPVPSRANCELANMLTTAALVAEAALARAESRGTHFRDDFPARDDARFCRRIFLQRAADGAIRTEPGPLHPATDRLPA
ncbi:MAG: L-aspartate oxidase [Planctomycetes bacterium]|jgi:L-aspartate oxidase|nr:L-aspartate oxidase [Planctomycetota bacterium]